MLSKGFGGAERFFIDLSLALAQRGHQIQVLCEQRFVQRSRFVGNPNIQVRPLHVLGTWDRLAAVRLRGHIAEFKPAVIQGHLARAARLAGLAARKLNIPLVVKTHNYVDLKYYRDVTRFITTTADQRDYLVNNGIAGSAVEIIPNFSALPSRPVRPSAGDDPVRLVSYGRMVRKKGFDVLLRALRRLLDDGRRVTLLLGGDGPETKNLRAHCERLEMNPQVRFAGWVDDVGSLLEGQTAFVLPSLDEPFGIVVLEAMAAGIPVVSTRTRGPSEVLDARIAYLCEVGDEESLYVALKGVCEDLHGRTAKAVRAQQIYEARYSQAAVVPEYERVYEALGSERGSA